MIESVRMKMKNKEYSEALSLLERIDEKEMSSEEYLLKGVCIQLVEEDNAYSLQDVEKCFLKAIELDNKNLRAKIELGWYYLNVDDKPDLALKYFEEALEFNKNQFKEILLGILKCHDDLKGYFDYKFHLKDLENKVSQDEEFLELSKSLIQNKKIYSVK